MNSNTKRVVSGALIVALMSTSTIPLYAVYTAGEGIAQPLRTVRYSVPPPINGDSARKLVSGIIDSPQDLRLFHDGLQTMAKVANRDMATLTREELIELFAKYQKDSAASKSGDLSSLRGHLAEEIAKRDLAAAGYKVEFTKPGSLSSDLWYTNGTGKNFGQVKVCSTARASMDGALEDAIAFRATGKPEVLKFEGIIPKDQFAELVREGVLTKEGHLAESTAHSGRLYRMVQRKAAVEVNKLTNAGRFAMVKTEAEVERAIRTVRFRPISMTKNELTGYTEQFLEKVPGWLKNLKAQSALAGEETAAAALGKAGSARGATAATRGAATATESVAEAGAARAAGRAATATTATMAKGFGITLGAAITIGVAAHEFDAIERDFATGKISSDERARRQGQNAASASFNLIGVGLFAVTACPLVGVGIFVVVFAADMLISPIIGEWMAERERITQARLEDLHLIRLQALNEFPLDPVEYAKTGASTAACAAYAKLYATHQGQPVANVVFIEPDTLALHRAAGFTQEAIN